MTQTKEVLTLAEYRERVESNIAVQVARGALCNLRGVHSFASEVEVPDATHAMLVHTDECFHPSCHDHGWM